MDLNSLSAQQYLNQAFVPFSTGTSSATPGLTPITSANNGNDFAQLLERAAAQNESSTPVLPGGKAEIDRTSQLYQSCQELETFLLKTLISSMRNTIQKSDLIDTGFEGQFYEDMLYDEYAKEFTKNAALGFADMAYLELTGQRGKMLPVRPESVTA